jgi:DNA-binding MarR family transcriptional regulator
MIGKPDGIVVRAWARLMKAQQLAFAAVERDLKAAGLPPLAWYDVLLEVECAGGKGLRPYELERVMLLAQYNLSRLIDRIERAGYVERRTCEDDGRGQMIVITEGGKALRRKMWPVYARAIAAAVGKPLSPNEAETLAGLLGRIIDGQRDD